MVGNSRQQEHETAGHIMSEAGACCDLHPTSPFRPRHDAAPSQGVSSHYSSASLETAARMCPEACLLCGSTSCEVDNVNQWEQKTKQENLRGCLEPCMCIYRKLYVKVLCVKAYKYITHLKYLLIIYVITVCSIL